MTKILNWNLIQKDMTRKVGQGVDVNSGKELMEKAYKNYENEQKRKELLKSLDVDLNKELMNRLLTKSKIKVLYPIEYIANVVEKSENNAHFRDERMLLNSGIELIFKCLEKQTNLLIFKDQYDNEYEFDTNIKEQLILKTDIYQKVYNDNKGE